jgi:hypothetical protein
MAATQRPRSRAGLFLLLYLLSSGAAARVAEETHSTAGKLGAFVLPLTFLALGVHAAFKNGGRTAKVCSTVLVGILMAAFAVGVYRGYAEHRLPPEVGSEVRQLQAGLALDVSRDAPVEERARRQAERLNDASQRLQASDNPQAAEFGRALELLTGLASEADARFLAATNAFDAELLLDVADMVDGREFEWRREALAEYAAAARAGVQHVDSLPERARAMFVRERITGELAAGMLIGVRDQQPILMEAWRQHERVADAYLEMVTLVEQNVDAIRVEEDGTFEFEDADSMQAFEQSTERAIAAEEGVQSAIARLISNKPD